MSIVNATNDVQPSASRYAWVDQAMPMLRARMRELRGRYGDAHVNECWKRGVVMGEPDWFFAVQGSVRLGTPFTVSMASVQGDAHQVVGAGQCLVVLREPERQHAAQH